MASNETARPGAETVRDGPTLEQYVETRIEALSVYLEKRFDLLIAEREHLMDAMRERIENVQSTLGERITKTVELRQALQVSIDDRFAHADKINALVQDAAKRAVDKAEGMQHGINEASNEWRATLGDFSGKTVQRPEFTRLSDDFAAYRLESERKFAAMVTEKTTIREVKDDGRATVAIAISIIFGLASFAGVLFSLFRH